MTQPVTHDHTQREFKSYKVPATDDAPEYEFEAHEVTKETAGRVSVPGGTQDVGPGDVLVPTERGDVFHVLPAGSLREWTASKPDSRSDSRSAARRSSGTRDSSRDADSRSERADETSDDWGDPSEHKAADVKRRVAFLRESGRHEEADSLVNAERNGKNRKSALA